MQIIWIASYPRSGNTWMRFFLYHYLWGQPDSSEAVANRIPDIHKTGNTLDMRGEGTLLVKTHDLMDEMHWYHQQTQGFIYILRHPKDVLLSCYNFCQMEGDAYPSLESFAEQFIRTGGVPKWHIMRADNWLRHVESWLSLKNYPHAVIRYEDMLKRPEKAFEQVLKFLGLEVDQQRLEAAIEGSSFSRMKQMEMKERNEQGTIFTSDHSSIEKGHRFVNQGASKQSLASLSKEMDALFNQRFGEAMTALGYDW